MDEKKIKKNKNENNVETMEKPKTEKKTVEENVELIKAKADAQNYLEMAQRVTAEFENYRKRNALLEKSSEEKGVIKATEKLLPCIDAFDNAFKMIKDESVLEGVKLVYETFISALNSLGIEEISAQGEEFNPELHNAVIATDDEENAGKVIEVYQKGFKMGDRVIRYSMVRVGK